MLNQIVRLSLILAVLAMPASCKKPEERVPVVFVDFTLYLNLPEYTNLASPGGWLEITGGSRGIIVYRRNMEEFVAFDRHCTYKVQEYCRVDVDEQTGITAVCECCESVFSIYDGIPLSGQASVTLSDYRTNFNGNTNLLRIFNF
jgi:nitrite reductase/ring-hydroxylating ferredoxin subunit